MLHVPGYRLCFALSCLCPQSLCFSAAAPNRFASLGVIYIQTCGLLVYFTCICTRQAICAVYLPVLY